MINFIMKLNQKLRYTYYQELDHLENSPQLTEHIPRANKSQISGAASQSFKQNIENQEAFRTFSFTQLHHYVFLRPLLPLKYMVI